MEKVYILPNGRLGLGFHGLSMGVGLTSLRNLCMTLAKVIWNFTWRIGRMILDLIQNGLLVWPNVVQEDGTARKKTYAKLSATEKLQADCDCKVTNILKRSRNAAWFKEKAMLVEAQEAGQILDEEQLAFLAYPCIVDDVILEPQVFYDDTREQALGYQNPFYLKKAQRIKLTLYDGSVISSKHVASPVIDDEETLILEELSRSKMLAKQNDPMSIEKKVNTTPINYVELNRLSEDFDKCFIPQQELSDEQVFWLQTSHPKTNQSASSPINIEAPGELPKNGIGETRNQTLMEAARTMFIFSKAPLFLWAEAINTSCYTQNHSLIRLHYNKTPYELMYEKKPDLSFLHVFGSLCYPTNDSKDLGKLNEKADIGIFVGYVPAKKAFKIYNRRTWKIMETIHVTFDELKAMASEQFYSGPRHQVLTPVTSSSGLVLNPLPQQPCNPPNIDDLDRLFSPMFDEYFNPP
nr:retrovirus-related Pol polyprotein from transposon TNT 1-94 [Tanacetum cinerariifolium]